MKVVFITPASDLRRNFFYRIGHLIYESANSIPGPLILGKILCDAGHEVAVYEELYAHLDFNLFDDADVIGISTMTATAPRAYTIADYFRAKGKRVIMGGLHASALPRESLKHCDQVVVGEAESVITDVIEGTISDPIVHAPKINNIDTIPFPDYSLIKTPVKTINITTSRGCPFQCEFCTSSRFFNPYRERTPDNVIAGLLRYRHQGYRNINFQDNNFTANKKRAKEILRKMVAHNLIYKNGFFFGRTDIANDEELLVLLKEAGFSIVLVGIESLNQKSLDSINKKQSVEQIERCVKKLAKYNMKLSASLVLGTDCDTTEDIHQTVNYCRKTHAYSLQPPPLTPLPGTPLFDRLEKEKRIITKNWDYYDMMHVVFHPKNMSPVQLQKEFFTALHRFYTFTSSLSMLKIFGPMAAIKRIGMALIIRACILCTRVKERSFYRMLRTYSKASPDAPEAGDGKQAEPVQVLIGPVQNRKHKHTVRKADRVKRVQR